MHILIIEDQENPLEMMQAVLNQEVGLLLDIAKWYTQAEEFIKSGCPYDIIFLDHRMPYDNPHCTDSEDYDRFTDQLQDIGYGLIETIREHVPEAVIVGTSSFTDTEIRRQGYEPPNRRIAKIDAWMELPLLIAEFMEE